MSRKGKVFEAPSIRYKGNEIRWLLRLDLPSHAAADCPLCAAGGAPEKPGSRPQG